MNITIIANGQFPTQPALSALLEQSRCVVCCDGALKKFLAWQQQRPCPADRQLAVVGDGDSVSPDHLREAEACYPCLQHVRIAEQEDNDLTKSVRYAMERWGEAVEAIDILGATGLREDHTLGNISLLAYYTTLYPQVRFRMHTDHGTFIPMEGHARFDSSAGQQVSLFSLTPQVPVSVEGLRYPIHNRCIGWWWEATLNEALGDHFEVSGGRVIVFLVNCEL